MSATTKRERGEEFLALTTPEQADLLKRQHSTHCHLWRNFIPRAFAATLDPNDAEERRRWNVIFHYQQHPYHRPVKEEERRPYDIMRGCNIIAYKPNGKRRIVRRQMIVGVDASELPVVGKWIGETGAIVWVELVNAHERVWEEIQ